MHIVHASSYPGEAIELQTQEFFHLTLRGDFNKMSREIKPNFKRPPEVGTENYENPPNLRGSTHYVVTDVTVIKEVSSCVHS